MDTEFVGGLIAVAVSALVAVRQTQEARKLARDKDALDEKLTKLNSELETERHKAAALIDREFNAEDVLTKYSEPLAAAAFDLQSRCYNIVRLGFFEKFGPGHDRFDQAQTTTLFRFAQYFGWTEILRRDIQFLSFPKAEDTKRVTALQAGVARALADSKPGTKERPKSGETLMIWVDEQRAIGERMIVAEHEKVTCMGYARFCDEYEKCFEALFERVRADLLASEAVHRLTETQHLLSDLVRALDSDRDRYTRDLDRA